MTYEIIQGLFMYKYTFIDMYWSEQLLAYP